MSSIDIQSGGMLLCETWKLFPIDDRNWELCELRQTADNAKSRERGTSGTLRWQRCGRFYSYNTIGEAIGYVADVLAKRRCMDEAIEAAALLAYMRDTALAVARAVGR